MATRMKKNEDTLEIEEEISNKESKLEMNEI
jgi:hypothetical protein